MACHRHVSAVSMDVDTGFHAVVACDQSEAVYDCPTHYLAGEAFAGAPSLALDEVGRLVDFAAFGAEGLEPFLYSSLQVTVCH